ncbi:HAD family hydrolase [Aquabacterium sp. OR-4]|uniref:HAD family hydrolase n=1 Tax=Aquabacterium sp. OR-4 TaxID=2978127 RepID=UPI0021B178A4|nr:HAD-IA family hydrolase [Aquabacterium sp. OR-4]MDT7836863.1 HAD-IA family hydrolase [Aquabacterium sp. OR-4]
MGLRAITLDLDDTLWPVWPAIHRAEARLHDWMREHAPATAAAHDVAALREIRAAVARDLADQAHDLSAMRRESIRRALLAAGDDPALAVPAFDTFMAARQQVELFDDVVPALARLAARYPIVALSNGNADVRRMPAIAGYFSASLSALDLGVGKPAPAAFAAACARAGCAAHETLHVGDDGHADIDGALAAGLQAAWVRRPELPPPAAPQRTPQHVVTGLAELVTRLGC